MKYYSDELKKLFNSEDELLEAEREFSEKEAEKKAKKEAEAAERKRDAHNVEELLKESTKANKAYREALNDFCKKWGSFHYSVKSDDIKDDFNEWDSWNSLINYLFR